MALDKARLIEDFIDALTNPSTENNAEAKAIAMANAVDAFVKTGNAVGTDTNGDGHTLTIV